MTSRSRMRSRARAGALTKALAILLPLVATASADTGDKPQPADAPSLRPVGVVFGEQRSDKEDVIFFRNKDILRGTVMNAAFGISTPYGRVNVDRRRCAGVSFEDDQANMEALVTVNRNRLTGVLDDRIIRFRIGTSGEELDIRKEKIQFVLLRRMRGEVAFARADAPRDLFVMANGDLLTGKPAEDRITVSTDYGAVNVAFAEIHQVEMQGGENVTAVICKKNKDVMRGTLDTEEITLRLDLGVTVEGVYKDKFAKIFVDHIPDEMDAWFGLSQAVRRESDGGLRGDGVPSELPRQLKLDLV